MPLYRDSRPMVADPELLSALEGLRELVREALKHHVCSLEWDERAEKALEKK